MTPPRAHEAHLISDLDDDVRAHLGNAGANQAPPIDRLRHMNALAIELYRRYKIDIAAEPLEFAVNNQHMNGGIARSLYSPGRRHATSTASEASVERDWPDRLTGRIFDLAHY